LGSGVRHFVRVAVTDVQDGRLSQLFDLVVAMNVDTFPFHRNAYQFESDCYASVIHFARSQRQVEPN